MASVGTKGNKMFYKTRNKKWKQENIDKQQEKSIITRKEAQK